MSIVGRVRATARGGEAVVETSEGVVFVPGALRGERVVIETLQARGRTVRGRLLQVLEPSLDRRQAPCPLVDRCGGCPLMIANLDEQRRIKLALVHEALGSAIDEPGLSVEWRAADDELGYRRRARLAWSEGRLGYRRRHSRHIVDVPACVVLGRALQRACDVLRAELLPVLTGTGEVLLSRGLKGRATVSLRTEHAQPQAVYAACETAASTVDVAGIALRIGEQGAPACWGDPTEVLEGVDGDPLIGTVGGFSQANDSVNADLVHVVVELAAPQDKRVLELYAGTGNLTVALAIAGGVVTAIESDQDATRACQANLAARGLKAKVRVADAETPPASGFDICVLDPPRTGARQAMQALVAQRTKRIVYVSCDTGTLGRDLAIATEHGYRIDRVVAFDMFPNTAQVETVVRLVCS